MATGAVPRVGKNRHPITEVSLDDLHPLHSVPRKGVPPNHIDDLANSIRTQGYIVAKAIPVVRMPDGRMVTFGGHHRVKAMRNLGEKTIPARIENWDSMAKPIQNKWLGLFPNLKDFIP